MAYDLINYFNKKFAKLYPQQDYYIEPGPFITISRQTGCNANVVAKSLQNELSRQNQSWRIINKEIIDEAAGKLRVDKQRINKIIHANNRSIADEILDALSTRYYKNDKMVRKAIAEVVKHDAEEGNVIIVGRGGVAVTQNVPNGIHVKLIAPLEWRIDNIVQRKGLTKKDAEEFIMETDRKRQLLLNQFSANELFNISFDLTINSATFTPPLAVNLILEAMKSKQLI